MTENKWITELRGLIMDVNENEIAAHIADGTLIAWTKRWRIESLTIIKALNEMLIREQN